MLNGVLQLELAPRRGPTRRVASLRRKGMNSNHLIRPAPGTPIPFRPGCKGAHNTKVRVALSGVYDAPAKMGV